MIYLILAIAGSASMSLVLKLFREPAGNRFGILLGNYLTCVLISFIMLSPKRLVFSGSPVTLVCGLVTGCLFVAALVLMQTSVRINGAILTATFSKLGLLVPLALSIFFLGERPKPWHVAGIALVFAAILRMQSGKRDREENVKVLPWMLAALTLCAGSSDSMSKVFERIGDRSEDALFFFFVFLTAAVLTAGLILLEKKRSGRKLLRREVFAGVAVGIPNYFSSALLLAALTKLPGYIVFTAFSTCTILLVSVVSAVFFREQLSRRQITSIGMILAALILLNI